MLGGRPTVTYAAYRTASTSIHHAIRSASNSVTVKAHMLAPANMVASVGERHAFSDATANIPKSCHVGDWAVRLGIVEAGREADFVIPVRDPWSVAHSIFVLNAPTLDPCFKALTSDAASMAHATDVAERIIFGAFPRELMTRWIRDDAAPALNWNPLALPFDVERGASEYDIGPWRVQVLRTDLSDERKSDVLRAFLHRRTLTVKPKNSALSFGPERAAIAQVGRAAIARRPDVVRALLDDEVCKHYWSDSDRERMGARWTAAK